MQFSVGVEYALHCLLNMVDLPDGVPIGIKDLAAYQGVSETYLSKMFTRLQKAGIVRSTPGVRGGYELARPADEITLWQVVEAIEGHTSLFQCQEIRKDCVLYQRKQPPTGLFSRPCFVHQVMLQAEQQMRAFLDEKTLLWLHQSREEVVLPEHLDATRQWFREALARRQ
jgi:Rrf2 family protein